MEVELGDSCFLVVVWLGLVMNYKVLVCSEWFIFWDFVLVLFDLLVEMFFVLFRFLDIFRFIGGVFGYFIRC